MPHYADTSQYTQAELDLWELLSAHQNEPFYTAKGLMFTYAIRGNELFVDRKEKSITRATVNQAYRKGRELTEQEGVVTGPKRLGTFGASYLYPVFAALELIKVPEKAARQG